MTLSLFMDEDSMLASVLEALRRAGFDCLTVFEASRNGFTDRQQLEFANDSGRTILTRNTSDFSALHREWSTGARIHGGIIVVTDQQMPVGTLLRAMLRIDQSFDAESIRNQLVHIRNYRD